MRTRRSRTALGLLSLATLWAVWALWACQGGSPGAPGAAPRADAGKEGGGSGGEAGGATEAGGGPDAVSHEGAAPTPDGSVEAAGSDSAMARADGGPVGSPLDVPTYHNDNARSAWNANESILTPANVQVASFGKVGFYPVDGVVYSQPLYLAQVPIPGGGSHDVLYVTTSQDSVYALDADMGTVLWHTQVLAPGDVPSDGVFCADVPTIGIVGTPVIDRTRGPSGAIYVAAMSKDASSTYHHRLHALDLTTGAELFGGPTEVTATYTASGASTPVTFDPIQYTERAALLLVGGVVYTTWASHCDNPPYTSWVMAYDATTLAQTAVLNVTPNGSGGGLWMGASGPAADSEGNLYIVGGNGTFDSTLDPDGQPAQGDYGNAFLKLSTAGGTLTIADYFWSSTEDGDDVDLGSSGPILLPDTTDGSGATRHLAVVAGKTSNVFVLDRDNLGKSMGPDSAYQALMTSLTGGTAGGGPAYFDGTLFYSPGNNPLRAYTLTAGMLSLRPDQSSASLPKSFGGGTAVSSSGTSNGILWNVDRSPGTGMVLYAYDPTNLANELYDSQQNASRDSPSPDTLPILHFCAPTIASGKVYVQTTTGVAVYGLLP